MNLTPQEIAWLLLWLEDHQKKMPGARAHPPHYNATSWDIDDLFRAFREDAVWSRDILWQAVSVRAGTGVWPKIESRYAFWLRQRWTMAIRYCRAVLETRSHSDPTAVLASCPKDAQAAIRWLLLDEWDGRLVDIWIRENARDCVSCDWLDDSEDGDERERELERYFERRGI
jgi:hypothetical protein